MTLDRRSFIKVLGSASGLALAGCASQGPVGSTTEIMPKGGTRRVVVVGGGFGGAIAAKYVRMLDKSIEVVMIEKNRQFISCPFSNFYIAGLMNDMLTLTIGYDKLAANHGIKMVFGEVTAIDPAAKKVVTTEGTLAYDRLIVSPGIDFRTEEIEGYDARTAEIFPHAWKAGAQSTLLRNQLQSMKDGGTVVISMPLVPYRCPPGPYERASLIASYLKKHKPKSKLILLDANPDVVSKKPLFTKAWSTYYKDNFQYLNGKKVTKVDTGAGLVSVEGIDDFKGDVINLIPAQRAGMIAINSGLAGDDKKWCPVRRRQFRVHQAQGHSRHRRLRRACFRRPPDAQVRLLGQLPGQGLRDERREPDERQGNHRALRHQCVLQRHQRARIGQYRRRLHRQGRQDHVRAQLRRHFTGGLLDGQGGARLRRKLAEEHPHRDVDLIARHATNTDPAAAGFVFWNVDDIFSNIAPEQEQDITSATHNQQGETR